MAHLMIDDAAEWREAAREELRQMIDGMLHTEKTHMAAAERLQRIHQRLGVAATVLATAAAATIVTSASKLAAGLFALFAAIASGVLTFIKPERAAEQHLAAGRQLAALRVHARQVLNLDLPGLGGGQLRETINDIAAKKAAIDEAAPGTLGKDYDVARKKIARGTFDRDR
jgi:SMODS and SLOG-associating 2TM effector domain family 4/Petal formation-expressed